MAQNKSPEGQATGRSVAERVHENLLHLGLEADRDYWFYGGDVPYPYTITGFCDRERLTPEVLIACNRAVASESAWSIRIGIIDPKTERLDPVATTSSRGFSLVSNEDWAVALIRNTVDRMKAADPQSSTDAGTIHRR